MRFTVQAPDGRKITLEGDTAPTESDLNQIFGVQEPQKDYTLGRIATVDSGATFGLGRKAGGLLKAVGSKIADAGYRAGEVVANVKNKGLKGAFDDMEQLPSFWDRYHEVVDPAKQAMEEYQKDKPLEAFALELGSSLANPVNMKAAGTIAKGTTKAAQALRSIGAGGAIGGAYAAGQNENLDTLGQDVDKGILYGTAGGMIAPAVGATTRLTGKGLKYLLGRTTGAGDVAVADAFRAGQGADKNFLSKIGEKIDAEGLEKKIQNNFNKIKQGRNMTYEEDMTRLKQANFDKRLNVEPIANDIKTIIREVEGNNPELIDGEMAQVLSRTEKYLKSVVDKPERQDLDGLDRLKKAIQRIKTTEGKESDAVKTQLSRSVENQIRRQAPKYKQIMDRYAADSELIDDLKKVFSLNRNANSETILKKMQSTSRNNANTDWGHRAELLKKLDPTGEIQKEISANALNSVTPRGLFGSGAFYGGLFSVNPLLVAASSPRAVGYGAYGLGKLQRALPELERISPYVAQLLNN